MAKTLIFKCAVWRLNLGGNHNFKYFYHQSFHLKWLSFENNTLGKLQPCFQRMFMFSKEHGYSPRKWFSLGQIQPCFNCVAWEITWVCSLGKSCFFFKEHNHISSRQMCSKKPFYYYGWRCFKTSFVSKISTHCKTHSP